MKPRATKKDTKKPLVKRQRGTSVGSIATNLHEGSRSEYLAQYVSALDPGPAQHPRCDRQGWR
jgi:hypothetical protein